MEMHMMYRYRKLEQALLPLPPLLLLHLRRLPLRPLPLLRLLPPPQPLPLLLPVRYR